MRRQGDRQSPQKEELGLFFHNTYPSLSTLIPAGGVCLFREKAGVPGGPKLPEYINFDAGY